MEWRRVQDERPRVSTSGGQSGGGPEEEWGCKVLPLVEEVTERKSAKEVQERQLLFHQFSCLFRERDEGSTYGFPSLPNTIPLDNLLFWSFTDLATGRY